MRGVTDEFVREGSWRVGVGGPVPGMAELATAKRQADVALLTLRGSGAACWTELSADALLAQVPRQVWGDALLPAGVARLLADPGAATLLPTLSAFLDCAGEVQRTAVRLSVHRATLYYRLGRIEQISGLNLRDGRDRLLLHLTLRLHQLHGTPEVPARSDRPGRTGNSQPHQLHEVLDVQTDVEEASGSSRRDAG